MTATSLSGPAEASGGDGLLARVRAELSPARVTALALVGLLVLSLVNLRPVRLAEAMLSSVLLSVTGFGAERLGTSVLVATDGGRAGFTIANGCSTALLAAPFLLVGALAVGTGRIRPGRALTTVAVALLGVIAVNQLRFWIVGASIGWFGFETGYGQSHVLIGTLVSTFGLVIGLAAFILSMSRSRAADEAAAAGAKGAGTC